MRPLVSHDPLAQTLATASVAVLVAAEATLNWRTRRTRNAPSDRGTYWTWGLSFAAAIFVASQAPDWAPGLSLSDGGWWPFVAGLVLFWCGVALRWWGVLTLGRYFQLTVVVQEGQQVIQTGPYRYLRHPGYAGALLLMLGIGLAFDNLLSVVACIVLPLLGALRRIKVEEDTLSRELGETYRTYAQRTSRLIPGVW
jgi:protein-S-isoprenylcysteine O-methyltransferase Ste14